VNIFYESKRVLFEEYLGSTQIKLYHFDKQTKNLRPFGEACKTGSFEKE
jgi:hypothetical protein